MMLHRMFLLLGRVCPTLMAPENGMIDCSLGDDGDATNGDTCTFTCDNGFTLRGSVMRECRINRRRMDWNGDEARCVPGMDETLVNTTTLTTVKVNWCILHKPFCCYFIKVILIRYLVDSCSGNRIWVQYCGLHIKQNLVYFVHTYSHKIQCISTGYKESSKKYIFYTAYLYAILRAVLENSRFNLLHIHFQCLLFSVQLSLLFVFIPLP